MSDPIPISDSCATASRAFSPAIVIHVLCRHCRESTPIFGKLHQALVLSKHRGHLGAVTVDVWLEDRINKRISEVQFCLLPIEVQAAINILSAN